MANQFPVDGGSLLWDGDLKAKVPDLRSIPGNQLAPPRRIDLRGTLFLSDRNVDFGPEDRVKAPDVGYQFQILGAVARRDQNS